MTNKPDINTKQKNNLKKKLTVISATKINKLIVNFCIFQPLLLFQYQASKIFVVFYSCIAKREIKYLEQRMNI